MAGLEAGGPWAAHAADIRRPAFTLAYDGAVWAERPAVPPAELTLACIAADCGRDTALLVVTDPRPLPRPGASAFTPGALASATIDLRAQDMTPGARLITDEPTARIIVGTAPAYRTRYRVEDRDLMKSDLIEIVVPLADATLHIRLTAPKLTPAATTHLDRLLASLHMKGGNALPSSP